MKRVLIGFLFLTGCGSDSLSVPIGEWGGRNVDLHVSTTGATASFKCGSLGVTHQPLTLDPSGHFEASGTFESHVVLGGPKPAQWVGSVNGDVMTLSLVLGESVLGPFLAKQGTTGTFDVCNF